MRRLNKKKKQTEKKEEVQVATKEPEETTAIATAMPFDFSTLGQFDEAEPEEEEEQSSRPPNLQFYTGKGQAAINLPRGTSKGAAFLWAGGNYHLLPANYTVMVLERFRYYATIDSQYKIIKAFSREPAPRDSKVKEFIVSLVLVLPGAEGPLPETFAPAIATVSTFKQAEVRGFDQHWKAAKRTTSADWVRDHPELAKAAQPKFRLASTITAKMVPTRNGEYEYVATSARSLPIGATQTAALQEYFGERGDEFQAVYASYQDRVGYIQSILDK